MFTITTILAIQKDINKCKDCVDSGNVGGAESLEDLIVSLYQKSIPSIWDGLSAYNGYGTVNYIEDIKVLKDKLQFLLETEGELFLVGQSTGNSISVTNGIHGSGNSTNTNTSTVTNTIDFKAELSKVRGKIEANEMLDDDAKEEIYTKLNEIESVIDEYRTNNEKWKKLKDVVKWVGNKSYKVGELILPILIKSMFTEEK